MTSPRHDPYVWIHLAGLATVPFWLDLCLSGLAVGDPVVPPWLELTTLGWVGTVPILWMQLQRPFYIFSIPGLAVRPDKLGEDRRRLLTLQRNWGTRILVCLSAIALFLVLYWLYQLAPIAADMTPFATKSRTAGWLICAVSFLFANLFAQVPATVIPLLLASPSTLENSRPFESTAILKRFMVLGLRVPAIVPDLDQSSTASSPSAAVPSTPSPSPSVSRVGPSETEIELSTRDSEEQAQPSNGLLTDSQADLESSVAGEQEHGTDLEEHEDSALPPRSPQPATTLPAEIATNNGSHASRSAQWLDVDETSSSHPEHAPDSFAQTSQAPQPAATAAGFSSDDAPRSGSAWEMSPSPTPPPEPPPSSEEELFQDGKGTQAQSTEGLSEVTQSSLADLETESSHGVEIALPEVHSGDASTFPKVTEIADSVEALTDILIEEDEALVTASELASTDSTDLDDQPFSGESTSNNDK